jgi:hypothetical protein
MCYIYSIDPKRAKEIWIRLATFWYPLKANVYVFPNGLDAFATPNNAIASPAIPSLSKEPAIVTRNTVLPLLCDGIASYQLDIIMEARVMYGLQNTILNQDLVLEQSRLEPSVRVDYKSHQNPLDQIPYIATVPFRVAETSFDIATNVAAASIKLFVIKPIKLYTLPARYVYNKLRG